MAGGHAEFDPDAGAIGSARLMGSASGTQETIVRRLFEDVFTAGDVGAIADVLAPDVLSRNAP